MFQGISKDKVWLLVKRWRTSDKVNLFYYLKFNLCCLVLNGLALASIWYANYLLLGPDWKWYGYYFINYQTLTEYEKRWNVDPSQKLFPKVTKCNYKRFGYTGTLEVLDAQCTISLNNLNQIIYLVLWLVYIILGGK